MATSGLNGPNLTKSVWGGENIANSLAMFLFSVYQLVQDFLHQSIYFVCRGVSQNKLALRVPDPENNFKVSYEKKKPTKLLTFWVSVTKTSRLIMSFLGVPGGYDGTRVTKYTSRPNRCILHAA